MVRANRERIYRVARFLLDDPVEAEDLTQSVFEQAWRGWQKFEGRSQPYTWLYRILLRSYHRQRRRRWWSEVFSANHHDASPNNEHLQHIEDGSPKPDAMAARNDDCLEVRAVVRGISPKLREVLVLRYTEDWSVQQIAQALDIPEGTVKSRLNLALKTVAQRLRSRGWK